MGKVFWIAIAALGLGLIILVVSDSGGRVFGLDTERFGSLVYTGVLAGVIGTGILLSGRRFGDVARSLAAWMLVILVFVAGYEYRYELQDFASRVSGGLIPGSPLSAFDADGRATVTLQKRPDGHFEARLTINGKTINTLVDTGATATVLTETDAAHVGFDTNALRFVIPVSTANGTANAARIVADEISIGGIARKPLPLLVAEEGKLDQSLLGMNFIGTLSGFELRGDRLILRD